MFLGIDLGTGSVKVLLLAEDGSQTGASRTYPIEARAAGWAETVEEKIVGKVHELHDHLGTP